MRQTSSLVPSVLLIATALTGCLDFHAEAEAERELSSIAENISARATTRIQLVANLDAKEVIPRAAFDVEDSSATTNFSTYISVYDALGTAHAVGIYFCRLSAHEFGYHVLAAGHELDPINPAKNVQLGSGILRFEADGSLLGVEVVHEVSARFAGTASNQSITLQFGSSKSESGFGTDGVTMYARSSNVCFQSQNGHSTGRFAGVEVRSNNEMYALYTNGVSVPLLGTNQAPLNETPPWVSDC